MAIYDVEIDAGHGGSDPGACANEEQEANLVLPVCFVVRDELARHGVKAQLTRTDNSTVSLSERTNIANSNGVKCLVSIHDNSASDSSAKGIETYCYNFKYRRLADLVHGELIKDKTLFTLDRGVKEADFHMLRESNMDACLVELGFISNVEDVAILKAKQREHGIAIAKGILAYLGVAHKPESTPVTPSTPKNIYYKVYVDNRWLPEVKNLEDYAGIYDKPIKAIMVRADGQSVTYKVSTLNSSNYYPYVTDHSDYAGDLKNNIDKVMVQNSNVKYRVHTLKGGWLPWVVGDSDYAGIKGKAIDGIQMQLI